MLNNEDSLVLQKGFSRLRPRLTCRAFSPWMNAKIMFYRNQAVFLDGYYIYICIFTVGFAQANPTVFFTANGIFQSIHT